MRLPAILDIPHSLYHADDLGLDVATLSRTTAEVLTTKSPKHAWREHPRLGGKNGKVATKAMNIGTVMHDRLLGNGPPVEVIDADSWRTNAAKKQREDAIENGSVPLLIGEFEKMAARESGIKESLSEFFGDDWFGIVQEQEREPTIVWESSKVICRCRLDLFSRSNGTALDLKFTENASDAAVERAMRYGSHALQSSVYTEAMDVLTPEMAGRNTFDFLFVEIEPPYGVRLAAPGPAALSIAESQWRRALKLWKKCLESGKWPGYPKEKLIVEASSFQMSHEMDKAIASGTEEPDFMGDDFA